MKSHLCPAGLVCALGIGVLSGCGGGEGAGRGVPSDMLTANATAASVVGPVTGRLLVAPSTQTDSDTNDTVRAAVSNSDFETAQVLPNPVVLGGFATVPNSGPEGPMRAAGDQHDFYRVALTGTEAIELTIATPTEGDLDLAVYDSSRTLVNSSVGNRATERVTVPAAGDYFVQVLAVAGTSNYVLTIDQTGSTSASFGFTLSDEFVPGEVLARFREDAAQKGSMNRTSAAKAQVADRHGMALSGGAPGLHTLMRLSESRTAMSSKLEPGPNSHIQYANETDRLKLETLYAIKELAKESDVEWALPNYIRLAQGIPNDPLYSNQRWHYELMRLPDAWDVTTGSTDVVVAVIDSGVLPHAELFERFVPGYDFISSPDNAGDGDGLDNNAFDPGRIPAQGNIYGFHGTHVAGTIGATGNNGDGVTGVAWSVGIMAVRVLGVDGRGSDDDIINGMLFAAGLENSSGFLAPQPAHVINMSLGALTTCPASYQNAVAQVQAAGVIVVASAGNESREGVQPSGSPANCEGVISVAAIGINSQRAEFSNAGAGVDVAAPGGDDINQIFSTYGERQADSYFGTYTILQGTSMAAPHVAGAIALMKAVNPALTPADVDALLASGALTDDIGPPGPDELGVGRFNAFKAVAAAATAGGTSLSLPGQLSVVASTLDFGDVSISEQVTVSNTGTDPVSVTEVVSSDPWIAVTADQVDASGLGTYLITVNRAGLGVGVYSGTVEFRGSTGNAVRTSVQMQITSTPVTGDAGQHYVLLLNPTTFETLYQANVDARGEAVGFAFEGVTPGSYLLLAGTDADNDGTICDEGEACGGYPLYGQLAPVEVNPSASGLDFPTGYSNNIRAASSSEQPQWVTSYRRLK